MAQDKQIQFEQPSNLLIFFNRFWIIVTAILVGVLLLGGYYFLIKPKMDNNDALRDNALRVQMDRTSSEQLLKNLEILEDTYKNIMDNRQADLERLKAIVPNNPQIAELFVISDKLAKQYGFQLLDISINDQVEKKTTTAPAVVTDTEDQSAPVTTVTTTPAKKNILALKTLSVDFKVTPVAVKTETGTVIDIENSKTNYQLFKDFLDALERNLRLTDIQTVNFSSLEENASSAPQFQFSVQTYYR